MENSTKSSLLVDFDCPELYTQTSPLTCTIQGQSIIPDRQSWSSLLVSITEHFISKDNPNLAKLSNKPLYGSKDFFMSQRPSSGACVLLSNGKWIYTGYNPRIIVAIIKNFCRHCGVSLNDVVITCLPKECSTVISKKTPVQKKVTTQNQPILFTEPSSSIDEDTKTTLVALLEKNFPNGIRPTSVIDINKLKEYYIDTTGKNLLSIGMDITDILEAVGISHCEKVYAIPAAGKLRLADLLYKLLAEGHRLFYYKEFYEAYSELMQEIHIFTPDLLRTVIKRLPFKFCYYKRYFVTDNEIDIESETRRCYETSSILSWEEVKAKLPFVPLSRIKHTVALNNDFIKVRKGVYAHISAVVIDDDDIDNAQRKIEREIAKHSYASLTSLNVLASLKQNPELSESAVKNGLFQNFFAVKYEKRGNIIMQKGKVPRSATVLEDFCLSKDIMKLKELVRFEKEIRGHSSLESLKIAYDKMIRTDKSTFVADNKLNFDIDAIDNALELFVVEKVIPLYAVTSFTTFPPTEGFPWNLFLLESYCRRFSRRFAFLCQLPNSRNIGAIFYRDAGFNDFIDVLAHAVALSSITMAENSVGEFLINNHYIGKKTSIIPKVITETLKLKENGI